MKTNNINGKIYFVDCIILWPPYLLPKEEHKHGRRPLTKYYNFLKIIFAITQLCGTIQCFNLDEIFRYFSGKHSFCNGDESQFKQPSLFEVLSSSHVATPLKSTAVPSSINLVNGLAHHELSQFSARG